MWHKITIHPTQIHHETDKAALIKLPSTSYLKGWAFWHPFSLLRENGNMYTLLFSDEWEFKLVRMSRNSNAKKKIGVQEMLDAFEKQVDEGENSDSYIIVEEPEKIDVKVEVDESLRR